MVITQIEEQKTLSPWNKIDVVNGNTYCWSVGEKEIFMRRLDSNWLFSERISDMQQSDQKDQQSTGDLTDLTWAAFVGSNSKVIQTLPAFPDRPLVLKPGSPLKVLPKSSVLLFLNIPSSIQFYSDSRKEENFIHESATKNWSSTWFGEPDNGELAYSLPFDTSEVLDKSDTDNSHMITCPVKVFNDSVTILDVQRLLLHGEYLNIYSNGKELCSNEVNIRFKGENVFSDVDYESKAPSFIKNAKLLAPSRTIKSNNVISKSFHFIKSLASS